MSESIIYHNDTTYYSKKEYNKLKKQNAILLEAVETYAHAKKIHVKSEYKQLFSYGIFARQALEKIKELE